MAFFGVTIEEIGSIDPIEGADRIVKATLKNVSFSFVVGKGLFNVADKVIYIPLDSIVPVELQRKLGVEGKLAGKDKNRVRTVKLKNTISQGLVGNLSIIDGLADTSPERITQFLGVTKYEPPVIADKAGNLKLLPNGLSVYDIEGCERYYAPLEKLMNKKVWVLEKMEGSNGSVTYDPIDKKIYVNQRRHTIEEVEGHSHGWWEVARKQRFIDFVDFYGRKLNQAVTIYHEVCGPSIQGNIYNLSELKGYIFDMKVGDYFINKAQMFDMLNTFFNSTINGNYLHAPILSQGITLKEWLNGRSVKDACHGESKLYPTLREGIVITPEVEEYDKDLSGRLILKQRDSIYLSKTDN